MARVVALIGTARPRPWPRPGPTTAVLMPTTSAALSASAPPRVAGVQGGVGLDDVLDQAAGAAAPAAQGAARAALTTPALTEPAKPSGLPMATTSWPTRSWSASPSTAGDVAVARGADDGEVGQRVGADDLEVDLAAVGEGGHAAVGPLDHVGGREQEPVGGDHHRRARALRAPPAAGPATMTRRLATDGSSRSATVVTTRE